MFAPYRSAVAVEVLEAPTHDGIARLHVAPHHTVLEVGKHVCTFSERFLTLENTTKRRKRRSYHLEGARAVITRAHPTRDVAVWYEHSPRIFYRMIGIRPVTLLDASALTAWRELDGLAERFEQAVSGYSGGVRAATELGRGQHRVVLLDYGDRFELYARPVFREHPRLIFEVRANGKITHFYKKKIRVAECHSRYGVTLTGDRINFANGDGDTVASVFLPWIAPEDRAELRERFAELLEAGHMLQPAEYKEVG